MRITYNYPQNAIFLDYNLKLNKMIDMHLKFNNMHINRILNALNCINNHLNSCINYMLSITSTYNAEHMYFFNIVTLSSSAHHKISLI